MVHYESKTGLELRGYTKLSELSSLLSVNILNWSCKKYSAESGSFCILLPFSGTIRRSEFRPSEILHYVEKIRLETQVKGRHSNQTFIELHPDDNLAVRLDKKWVWVISLAIHKRHIVRYVSVPLP